MEAPAEVAEEPAPAAKPARKRRGKAAAEVEADAEPVPVPAANDSAEPDDSDEPRRSGWWQKTFG